MTVPRFVTMAMATLLLSPATAGLAGAAGASANAALGIVSDPGSRPTFNPADYTNYRSGSGNSVIVGKLAIKETDPVHPATCERDQPVLYPNTEYTRWMIAAWLHLIDGRHQSLETVFPGDTGTNIWIPSYLSPMTPLGEVSDLQYGHCDATNTVTFRNVPAGNYILVVRMQRAFLGGANRPTGNVLVQTPNGEFPAETSVATVTGHLGDGYVLVSHDAMIVRADRSYTLRSDNVYPAAHFLPDPGR